MKKILIVGTSHTAGQCQNKHAIEHYNSHKKKNKPFSKEDIDIVYQDWLEEKDRWYQGLLENYEITTLSSPGASPAQQYWVILNYIHQYPEQRFDAALLEGRHPPSASQADWMDLGYVDTWENRLKLWLNSWPQAGYLKPKDFYTPFSHCREDNAHWQEWYGDYISNDLSLVDTITVNYASMNALDLISNSAKFMSFSQDTFIDDDKRFVYNHFKQEYGIAELWDGFESFTGEQGNKSIKQDIQCACYHYNKKGCKIISDYATPILEKELGLI